MDSNFRNLLAVVLASLVLLFSPTTALASQIQSLNGSTVQTQTFNNDSNVQISTNTATGVHSLIWQNLLPFSRGGTGASSFSSGSLIFSDGSKFAEDNSHLYWNNTNKALGIGTTPSYNKVSLGDIDSDWGYAPNKGVSLEYNTFNDGDLWGFSSGQNSSNYGIEMFWEAHTNPTNSIGHIDTVNYLSPIYVDASNFIINSLSNNPAFGIDPKVGIGTNTPQATLDVNGTIKSSSTIYLGSGSVPSSAFNLCALFLIHSNNLPAPFLKKKLLVSANPA